MEWRVAHAQLEALTVFQKTNEDLLRIGLAAQLDAAGKQRIGLHDGARRSQGGGVDIRTKETPVIVAVTDQRIDAVGADADIQHAHRLATRDHAVVVLGQQVGEVVHIVGATGNRRTQVAGRNVPVGDAVEILEQCPVEHLHRLGIGEVDAFLAVGIEDDEACQLRAALDQPGKVVAALVAIARVQEVGFLFGRFRGGAFRWLGHGGGEAGVGSRIFPQVTQV
ncbi:hypothetical protein D3C78_537810 [compost metagenome]